MLVLFRRREEKIVIGGDIEVIVLHAGQDGVKLGVRAPRHVPVYRGEIYDQIASENRAAVAAIPPREDVLAALRRSQQGLQALGGARSDTGDE